MMDLAQFLSIFNTVAKKNGLSALVGPAECEQFYRFFVFLTEENEKHNLTAIRDPESIIVKHFLDSLTAASFFPRNASLLDVGCGAGFPSVPLAICKPDLRITALDSTEKKTLFVQDAARMLALDNLCVWTGRAETLAHNPEKRESFDCCTARAVAALPELCELCLPFVRPGGLFLAMKAKRGEDELQAAMHAIHQLGGDFERSASFYLKDGFDQTEERVLFLIRKKKKTPAPYPRAFAKIKKSPLI